MKEWNEQTTQRFLPLFSKWKWCDWMIKIVGGNDGGGVWNIVVSRCCVCEREREIRW